MVTLCGKFSSSGLTFESFHLWFDIQKACREDGISQKSELWSTYVVNLVVMGWLLRIFACEVIFKKLVVKMKFLQSQLQSYSEL